MNALNEINTYTKNKDTIQMSQSQGLSQRITQLGTDGRQLIDDSCISEKTLNDAMDEIIPYATSKIAELGGTVKHLKKMSLYDCQLCFEKVGGPASNESNKNVFMKPDGGILVAEIYGKNIPILHQPKRKMRQKHNKKINLKSHSLIFSFGIYNFGSITRLVI